MSGNHEDEYQHCQKIIDIHDAAVSVELPELISEKYKIVDQSLIFYGTCLECQETMRMSTTN